ncbi:UDP-galactose 4-epimerase [Haloactinospora alba]|uniref:UDP-glucose 4-epimerase n=1 Tax=Haloactinospora alba TaxID=405555 RepID=A0A543N9B9_9ACTN|nr:UDP-glucose 4-epimerase GalE [Haloactinospora alba]TQN28408.1 UDP-galactose 4-epimerase [Haloactinospora alba]
MKLLVTGGAGYVGSVVAALLLDAGHTVTVLDDLSTGHRDAVPPGASLAEADLTEAGDVLDPSYDAVLHFAAKSLVSESTRDPRPYWRTNVSGTLALLDAVRRHGTGRVVLSSTAAVYGEPDTVPVPETAPALATNPYGDSKLAADRMLESWSAAYGIGAVSLRYFNVAGARGRYGERHDPETHLVPNLLRVASGREEHARIHGTDYPTRDGSAVRDYLHVSDLADAHLRALDRAQPGTFRVYNLGTGSGCTVREVLDAVRRVTGHPVPAVAGPRRPGDPAVLVASNERARHELGWEPRSTIGDIVADAWAFARERGGAR